MGHLRALADLRLLELHEGPGLGPRGEHRSGAKVTERPHERALADLGVVDHRVRADLGPAADDGAAAQDRERVDDRVGLDVDVGLDPGRRGVDDGDPGLQVRRDDLVAKPRAGGSEIGPGVHAFANTGVFRTVHGNDAPVIHQVTHRVGEVELPLRVVGVEPRESTPRARRRRRCRRRS